MTIAEIQEHYARQLLPLYPRDEGLALAGIALNHVCGITRSELLLGKNTVLNPLKEISLLLVLDELLTARPIQYILGETEFYGMRLKVTPDVLIPRPETEELVHWVIETARSNGLENGNILDIGTGSGCIALALKKNLPKASLWALDISEEALNVVRENAKLNNLDIETIQTDILDVKSQVSDIKSQISVIVSNPPYIALSEKDSMHQNVLDHEPHTALFVNDPDPLLFYRRIADYAWDNLGQGGYLFFEINERFGQETIEILLSKGFSNNELKKDVNGKYRMARACRP